MTIVEIKTKIIKKIDELPEYSLTNVLDFLNDLEQHPEESDAVFDAHLKKIIFENRELLKKQAD